MTVTVTNQQIVENCSLADMAELEKLFAIERTRGCEESMETISHSTFFGMFTASDHTALLNTNEERK